MPVLPAALLVAGLTVWAISRSSIKVDPTVTFAKPTTVYSAITAALAGLAVTITIIIGMGAEWSPLWVLLLAWVVGVATLRIGGKTNGNRVVYDRGARRLPAARLFGILTAAAVGFMLLIYQV